MIDKSFNADFQKNIYYGKNEQSMDEKTQKKCYL